MVSGFPARHSTTLVTENPHQVLWQALHLGSGVSRRQHQVPGYRCLHNSAGAQRHSALVAGVVVGSNPDSAEGGSRPMRSCKGHSTGWACSSTRVRPSLAFRRAAQHSLTLANFFSIVAVRFGVAAQFPWSVRHWILEVCSLETS